jgi:hypothetical protein
MNASKGSLLRHLFRNSMAAAALVPPARSAASDASLPAWTKQGGARGRPDARRVCPANARGATGDSTTTNTDRADGDAPAVSPP